MKLFKRFFAKIFTIKDSPNRIAKGFALGSFIGMMPIPGFQIFVAYALSKLFNYNSKSACIAVFNTNLFTGVFIFGFNYWLGKTILGLDNNFTMPKSLSFSFVSDILNAGSDIFLALTLGGIITGSLFSIAMYYILNHILVKKARRI